MLSWNNLCQGEFELDNSKSVWPIAITTKKNLWLFNNLIILRQRCISMYLWLKIIDYSNIAIDRMIFFSYCLTKKKKLS